MQKPLIENKMNRTLNTEKYGSKQNQMIPDNDSENDESGTIEQLFEKNMLAQVHGQFRDFILGQITADYWALIIRD